MSEVTIGRIAGWLYLVVVITGIFSLAYVPTQINSPGNPLTTLGNMIAHEALFGAGNAAFLVEQVAFLLLPLVLYRLFVPVDRRAAILLVAFALAAIPIAVAGLVHRMDALTLLTDADLARALSPGQLQAMALLSLEHYSGSIFVASMFWGLWLLPFGYLVVKSGAIPRVLGVLLMLGGAGYLLNVFGTLLLPGYGDTLLSDYATRPASLGEIGSCLWLLVFGARRGSCGHDRPDTSTLSIPGAPVRTQ